MNPKDIPAFPVLEQGGDGRLELGNSGMSLRDYFAAAAIPTATAWEQQSPTGADGFPSFSGVARRTYLLADEMLKARTE